MNNECKEHSGCMARIQNLEHSNEHHQKCIEQIKSRMNQILGGVLISCIALIGNLVLAWLKTKQQEKTMDIFMDPKIYAIISIILLAVSEAVGMSKFKSNSIVQLVLNVALNLFKAKKAGR